MLTNYLTFYDHVPISHPALNNKWKFVANKLGTAIFVLIYFILRTSNKEITLDPVLSYDEMPKYSLPGRSYRRVGFYICQLGARASKPRGR
jgi:hypothetical protein